MEGRISEKLAQDRNIFSDLQEGKRYEYRDEIQSSNFEGKKESETFSRCPWRENSQFPREHIHL